MIDCKTKKLRLMEKRVGHGEKNTELTLIATEDEVEITIGSRMQINGTRVSITPFEARVIAIHLLELANEAERQVRVALLSKAPIGSMVKLVAVSGCKKG